MYSCLICTKLYVGMKHLEPRYVIFSNKKVTNTNKLCRDNVKKICKECKIRYDNNFDNPAFLRRFGEVLFISDSREEIKKYLEFQFLG